MAVAVKDAASSAAKYATNAANAGPAYTAGVQNAGGKWAAATAASGTSWAQGVTAAATSGRFASSITPAATSKYQTRASSVGPARYAQGVQGAQSTWMTNTQPYLQTIANLNLPPRQPKGSAANTARVTAVTQALRAKKLGTATS